MNNNLILACSFYAKWMGFFLPNKVNTGNYFFAVGNLFEMLPKKGCGL